MSAFRGGGLSALPRNGIPGDFNQGLSFAAVAHSYGGENVDSVTWASGAAMWQTNRNTFSTPAQSWPLQKAAGRDVYRMETRPGDQGWDDDDPALVTRSFLNGSNHPAAFATDYDLAFGFLVEPGFSFSPTFGMICEYQGTMDAGDTHNTWPPFIMFVEPSGPEMMFKVARRTSNASPLTSDPGINVLCSMPLARGVRHEVYMRHNWQPGGTGKHVVWLNGVKVVDYSGATGYNDAVGPWLAVGPYHSRVTENLAVQIAHLEHSTSDLSARIATPLAW